MGAANEIMLTVKMKDTAAVVDKEALIETVDVLAEHLSQIDTCHVKSIKYMVDQEQIMQITNFITANLPYFLTEADYARMDSLISQDIIRKKLENTKSFLSSLWEGC